MRLVFAKTILNFKKYKLGAHDTNTLLFVMIKTANL